MIYVASPYSHKSELIQAERYEAVMKFVATEMREGKRLFSPILYAHAMALKHELPKDADYWWNFNREMINNSDEFYLFALSGWRTSLGVTQELEYWTKVNDKPIFYVDPLSYDKSQM